MKLDVVYVLGSGSRWHNNEIRFSLRSIAKNLQGYRNIYVVGDRPDDLKNIIHIPYPDELPNNADGNIIRKVLRACQEPGLSRKFLFINDDHLINQPVSISAIPAFHKGDLTTFPADFWRLNPWRSRLQRTRDELVRQGLPTFHFDCHTPILIDKIRFPEIIARFDYSSGIGLCMKSLYGNIAYPNGILLTEEKKTVFQNFSLDVLNRRLKDCMLVSFNDDGLNVAMKVWLYQQFTEPSPWEAGILSDSIIEIYHYLQGEQDYATGQKLYEKYGNGINLRKLFSRAGETPQLKRKLIYKLKRKLEEL